MLVVEGEVDSRRTDLVRHRHYFRDCQVEVLSILLVEHITVCIMLPSYCLTIRSWPNSHELFGYLIWIVFKILDESRCKRLRWKELLARF